jgi:flavin reductase (DIM6/NTAB) family NADH-FMN oxidoreductase RutF
MEDVPMIPEKLLEVLKHEGMVAIATQSPNEPHLVNTWNSYVQISDDGRILIPVGGMKETETNLAKNKQVVITMGSREVEGKNGPGAGFLIKGAGAFVTVGADFARVKNKFQWARAALAVTVVSTTQTL